MKNVNSALDRSAAPKSASRAIVLWRHCKRYAIAVAAAAGASVLRAILDPIIGHNTPYMPFVLAVLLSGRFLGRGPALLVTALSVVSAWWWFLAPGGNVAEKDPMAGFALALFAAIAIGASFVTGHIRDTALLLTRHATVLREQAQMIDLSHDAIIRADARQVVTGWNTGAEELYGWTRAQAVGCVLHELLQTAGPVAPAEIDCILASRGRWDGQLVHTARNGRKIQIESRQVQIRTAEGIPAGMLQINRDITERQEQADALEAAKEAAEKANRAKSEFLANMSHEIRTPMNGVIGMTELLLNSPLSTDQRDCAATLVASAESLLTVLDDILDFSKIEAGKLSLEAIPFDLENLLKETLAIVTPLGRGKGLDLTLSVSDDVPRVVLGDPARVRQILMNLLSNAIKFTSHGSVNLRVSSTVSGAACAAIRVEVKDTGPGIAPDVQARLFQPFSQADATTTRRYGGTGLGLSIAKRLIDLMSGSIGVTSTLGAGSIFWFCLTLPRAESVVALPDVRGTALIHDVHVLVVEDNLVNQKVARRMLERLGCTIETAGDGRSALTLLATRNYDLVLMDCHMPELDGYEATRRLRAHPEMPRMPVIALTAGALVEDRERALAAGMDDYLTKPVQLADIARILEKWSPQNRRAHATG